MPVCDVFFVKPLLSVLKIGCLAMAVKAGGILVQAISQHSTVKGGALIPVLIGVSLRC